ncbi:MAG: ATP-dependent helicase, partial [bacterium]
MSDPILDPLNEKQREAVTYGEGPLLILAGAGSGKTRTIIHRIAHLIRDRGVRPYRILGVTFTNKAADEMCERAQKLVGRDSIQPELRTFHSFGVHLLRKEIAAIDRDRNFTIYDETEQKNIIKDCLSELHLDPDQLKPRSVVNRISRIKDQLWSPEDYVDEVSNADEELVEIYRLYQEKLRNNNAYDFGDLIVEPVHLLESNPEVKQRWQQQFEHILVDEFQDTNPAQYQLARLLSGKHKNIAVVGDDDQSIYSWRGADITNILEFEQDFPETKTVRLERNYRSTKPILDVAHQIIKNNTARKPKELWTSRKEGRDPVVYEAASDYDEAQYVVETIQMLEKMHNISPGECAIFFRANAQTRVFEEVFMRENMPYVIVSGVGFYERKEIKDLMAYLTLIVNPADDQALGRVINTPTRGIGKKTMQTLFEYPRAEGEGPLEVLPELIEDDEISGRARSALGRFYNLYCKLRELRSESPLEVLESVLEYTDYIEEEVEKEDESTAQSRKENIDELLRVAGNYSEERAEPSLAEFVEEVSLLSDVDTFEEQSEHVNLMTLHAAKGLEFPVVFMSGMEAGLLPHGNSDFDQEKLEEERRLCYVGFTRAQERLYCTWSR